MKVAFHSGYLGFRGTEVALVDYGRGNREVLGGESFFVLPWRDGGDAHPVVREMRKVGPVHFIGRRRNVNRSCKKKKQIFSTASKTGFRMGRNPGRLPPGFTRFSGNRNSTVTCTPMFPRGFRG